MQQIEKPSVKKVTFRVLMLVIYLLMGGAVFRLFEREHHMMAGKEYRKAIEYFRLRYNVTEGDMNDLEQTILQDGKYYTSSHWSFSEAFFFAGTTLLTVGYGNLVPRTTNGRLFCIFYAFLGIPIACLALKSIAERIMLMEVFLIKVMWKYFSKKDQVRSVHFKSIILNFLLTVTAVLLLAFMANIKRREWSYFECIYFSFITFTTIGFGDYIPTYGEAFSEYDILIVAISFFVGFTLVSCLLCSVSYALEEHSRSVLRRAKSTIEHSKMGRARSRTLDMATCDTTLSSNDGVKTCHVSRDNETGVTLQKFSDVKEDPE